MDRYNNMVSKDKKNARDDFIDGWNSVEKTKKDNSNISTFQQISKQSKELTNDKNFIKTVTDTILSVKQKDEIIQNLVDNSINHLYEKLVNNDFKKKDSLYDYEKFKEIYVTNLQKEIAIKNIDYKINIIKEPNDIVTSSPWLKKYTRFFNSKTKNVGKAIDSLGYKRTNKNIFLFKKLQELKKVTKGGDAGRSFVSNMISCYHYSPYF